MTRYYISLRQAQADRIYDEILLLAFHDLIYHCRIEQG
jgi:hypothetical protein